MAKACNNKDCSVSTGIHEGLTFGSGRLSMDGFWEKPCLLCARAWEVKHPDDGACWPYPDQDIAKLEADIKDDIDEEERDFASF